MSEEKRILKLSLAEVMILKLMYVLECNYEKSKFYLGLEKKLLKKLQQCQ